MLTNIIALMTEWGPNFMRGLVSTLQIALGAYALGIALGTLGAIGKLRGGPVLRIVLETYTTLFRALPELVLILLLYYAGTGALNALLVSLGFERVFLPGVLAGILVIGIVQGAYSTEVIRGAMLAVPKGQMEAATAFGMGPFLRFRRILLPAMLPLALPGLANLWLIVTKDTALLAVVGVEELALVTRQAAGSTRLWLEAFLVAGMFYLAITLVSNQLFRALERRVTRGLPQPGTA